MAKSSDYSLGDLFTKFNESGIADMLGQDSLSKSRPAEFTGQASARVEVNPDIKIPLERVKLDSAVTYQNNGGKLERVKVDLPKVIAASKSITAQIKRDKLDSTYRGGNSLPVTCRFVADNGGKGVDVIILAYASLNIRNSIRAINGELGSRNTRGDELDALAAG